MIRSAFFSIATIGTILISIFSCSNKHKPLSNTSLKVNEVIRSEMNKSADVIPNENGNYLLCVSHSVSPAKTFMVIDLEGNMILTKRKVRGDVSWYNNQSLEVSIYSGVIDKQSDTSGIQKSILHLNKKKETL